MAHKVPRAFGPYLLRSTLGRGAHGVVYLAHPMNPQSSLPENVVVKCLRNRDTDDRRFVRRFRHEAKIAVLVDSEHVARVYDVGAVGAELYIAMEYIHGRSLSKVLAFLLKSNMVLAPMKVVELLGGVFHGLRDLHRAKDPITGAPLRVVHRDVSPKNIMVLPGDRTKLIDLGVGRSELQDWKTSTGVVVGSIGYMAPEQIQGLELDHRVDQYAMAIVVYELLTLRRFIPPGPRLERMKLSLRPEFVPPSSIRDDLTPAIDDVLKRALAFDPEHRFESVEAFQRALEDVIEEADAVEHTTLVDREDVEETTTQVQIEKLRREVEPDRRATEVYASHARPTRAASTKPMSATPAPVPRRTAPWRSIAIVTSAVALVIGLLVGFAMPSAEPVRAPPPRPEVTAAPSDTIGVVQHRVEAPRERPKPEPPKVRRVVRKRVDSTPAPAPAKRATPSLEAIERRVLSLAKRAPSDRQSAIDRLLGDIAMERKSRDPSGARIAALNARAEQLSVGLER